MTKKWVIQDVFMKSDFLDFSFSCGSCLWFKTEKCRYANRQDVVLYEDAPCQDGFLVQFLGSDVLIKVGKQKIVKPLRFLSSNKCKNELMHDFELEKDEVEDIIIRIKNRHYRRKHKKHEKIVEKPRKIDPETDKQAKELLSDPEILNKFMDHSEKWIVMDKTIRKIELLTCVSAYGEYPINLALQQVWSAGKTKTITTVAKYFEDNDVWFVGAISPKALIHEKGEYDTEKGSFIVDLRNKIIIFLDEPEYHTLAMLKPLLSHDKFEIMYRYVSKDTMKTIASTLRGFPACVFCAVKSKYTEEFTSRWFTASPEIRHKKIRKVIELKGDMASEPEKYKEDEEFKAFKRAFVILREAAPHKVVIPFAPQLSKHFKAKKPAHMRFYDLLLALIKASCILHATQRQKDKNERLIATIQDYEIAKDIFTKIEQPTVHGLGQNVLDFYETIVLQKKYEYESIQPQITYETLMDRYSQAYGEPIGRDRMRQEYINPLKRKGLINLIPDPDDKRKKLVLPTGTLKRKSLIDDEGFKQIVF